MSAREGIFNYLTGRALCQTPRTAEEAEALLNAYAHELADKLRDRHSGTCGCGCDCSEFIDPEVLNNGS